MIVRTLLLGAVLLVCACAPVHSQEEAPLDRAAAVRSTEIAFAQTMADRDLAAFRAFIDEEAVFFGATVQRGPDAIVETWGHYFQGETAPFSWRPEQVEALSSGRLALSSGPVFDAEGKRVGTYQSIWRLDDAGHWKVVFDKGCDWCQHE